MLCLHAPTRACARCAPARRRQVRRLRLTLAVLALAAWRALVPSPSFGGVDPEIGASGSATPPAVLEVQSLNPGFEAGLQYLALTENDMNDTYGSLPVLGARLSLQVAPDVRFMLGAGYGRAGGDPYSDRPDFEGDDEATLHVVPMQMAVRFAVTPEAPLRLTLGFVLEFTWVRETLPPALVYESGSADDDTKSGLTRGVGATFGAEWRPWTSAAAIGLEAVATGNSGDIGQSPDRQVNLSGAGAHLYFTTGL